MKYCPQCKQEYSDTQRYCLADGQLLSLPDPYHLIGRTFLDKYSIEALVGIGGMGAVYAARHLTINRRIAFKILQPNLTLGNKRLLGLFQREAETAGQLSHENIVDINDAGTTPDGIAYIVMEWLDGPTLDETLNIEGKLSFERTIQITRQIAAALDHAHSHHIIHRDLKPSNIMFVGRPGVGKQVKVVDFGIAKVASETTTSPVSRLMGTPHYASPEQFRVGSHIDGRADIYSLGVMIYQMIAGELPFKGETAQELIRLQSTQPPPPIRRFRTDAPATIEHLLNRMLAKEPSNRPATASEAIAIFERAIRASGGSQDLPQGNISPTLIEPPVTNEFSKPTETLRERGAITRHHYLTDVSVESAHTSVAESDGNGQVGSNVERRVEAISESADKKAERKPDQRLFRGLLGFAVIAIALLAGGLALHRYLTRNETFDNVDRPQRVGLMSYHLEISSDQCQTMSRGSGDESLSEGQAIRFHFTPVESGYLYILAPNENNVPTTFLTAQPHPDTGVRTNFIQAGVDFSFPGGQGNCIGISSNEKLMAFTIIFSATPLASPSYLSAPALRSLTATEQHELTQWRSQFTDGAPQVTPDPAQVLSRVTIMRKPNDARPAVFDLLIKSQ